ncbi:MAG: hypothetical protein ABW221_12360 [Vicinamibacteria bacterium]
MRELRQFAASGLFVPENLPSGLAALFLRWAASPPRTLPIDRTWSDSGAPPDAGWFVFFDALPPPDAAAFVESELRRQLETPAATGFAWARWTPAGAAAAGVAVETAVRVGLDAGQRPAVAARVVVRLPPGLVTLGFGEGAPVRGAFDAQGLDAVVVSYPPQEGADPPRADGIRVGIAGTALGLVSFTGLVSLPVAPRERSVVKSLVRAQIDPLRPFDPSRTRTTSTGRDFLLTRDAGGVHLAPLPEASVS